MLPKDSVSVSTDQIDLAFTLSDLPGHIVPFLKKFNRIWWGRCRPDVFQARFRDLRAHTVNGIFSVTLEHTDWHVLKSLGNKMDMCRRPASETYRWPIMAAVEDVDTVIWNNGENRLLAAGIRWPDPCDQFHLVVLADSETQARTLLDSPKEITTDDQLSESLALTDRCRIQTRLYWKNGRYTFSIDDIGSTQRFQHTREDSVEWVRRFVAWRERYGQRPALRVFSDSPDQIQDHTQHWAWKWCGPLTTTVQDCFNQQPDADTHTLIIAPGHKICLDDLFLWTDLDHSVWQDQRSRCTLIRPHFAWSAGEILVSTLANE